ncbi:uncharacterized protein F4822DRAFT_408455 [Hypoxylon trugodes]|uniref:uncharacterized protein n=1 Tax=Hypoxylon trugodes TaxID=326681 RepID=UPI00219F7D0E|nr:uncharacterized protein F4822DRAFT_408455 [Hypoxylon trugodes]KAI1388043.1 hypothetical protein F4822DRAFT_408455 [Hypoxylon trugodes]
MSSIPDASDGTTKQQPPQVAAGLPNTTTYLTGYNDKGKAIVYSTRPSSWEPFDGGALGFNQIYTNVSPPDLNGDADIKFHDDAIAGGKLGLVSKDGVVCRMVDFSPQYECIMHRTKSMDFGIVVEGEVDMVLDDGSATRMKRGDIAVQRATMHAWRNPSTTGWARMVFVLQDCKPLIFNGQKLGEDLGDGYTGLPASGNDDE